MHATDSLIVILVNVAEGGLSSSFQNFVFVKFL